LVLTPGYNLAREASTIFVAEVITAMDDNVVYLKHVPGKPLSYSTTAGCPNRASSYVHLYGKTLVAQLQGLHQCLHGRPVGKSESARSTTGC